jgi:hypothetical protein
MEKKIRLTGEWPSLEFLAKYPNWEYALDEEGEEGQDETTIRPASNQTSIDEGTAYTAGTAFLSDGRSLPAILVIFHHPLHCPSVNVLTNDNDAWRLEFNRDSNCWEPFVETWRPEAERSPSVCIGDPKVFPLVVKSVLPVKSSGRVLSFAILRDGRTHG